MKSARTWFLQLSWLFYSYLQSVLSIFTSRFAGSSFLSFKIDSAFGSSPEPLSAFPARSAGIFRSSFLAAHSRQFLYIRFVFLESSNFAFLRWCFPSGFVVLIPSEKSWSALMITKIFVRTLNSLLLKACFCFFRFDLGAIWFIAAEPATFSTEHCTFPSSLKVRSYFPANHIEILLFALNCFVSCKFGSHHNFLLSNFQCFSSCFPIFEHRNYFIR